MRAVVSYEFTHALSARYTHVAAAGYTARAASADVCTETRLKTCVAMHGIDPMLPYILAGGGPFRGHMWGSAEFLDTKTGARDIPWWRRAVFGAGVGGFIFAH